MIYILEDNADRVIRFRAVCGMVAPGLEIRIWASAHAMISDLVDGLEHAKLILLDHDLNRPADEPDPGSGYDVAKLFEELIPCCPIIIHTSNGERGIWMEGALQRAGWHYSRVYPFGDDWIETAWAEALQQMLSAG